MIVSYCFSNAYLFKYLIFILFNVVAVGMAVHNSTLLMYLLLTANVCFLHFVVYIRYYMIKILRFYATSPVQSVYNNNKILT